MHHSWWSYNKTATPRRQENPTFWGKPSHSIRTFGCPTTTLLCSIFLPVLVKAIPCIGKDLGMCTVAYASLMVELQQDGYTSKTRESQIFWGKPSHSIRMFGCPTTTLLCSIFLPVLVKAIPCIGKDLGMCTVAYASLMVELQQDGYTSKTRESQIFEGNRAIRFVCLGVQPLPCCALFSCQCLSKPSHV